MVTAFFPPHQSPHNKILKWTDERKNGGQLVVHLRGGLQWAPLPTPAVHAASFDTVHEALQALDETFPCECPVCTKARAQSSEAA